MRPQQMPDQNNEVFLAEDDAEPDAVVWLRDMDGTGSMHPCLPDDPGAIRYIREDLVIAWSA
jgi:hypothetical protein